MNQATEVYSREFDSIFFRLPLALRERIDARLRPDPAQFIPWIRRESASTKTPSPRKT